VVPADVRQRINLALRYYDDHRTCVYCTMLAEELRTRERMVCESEHFACFVLYAALSPFHMWLLPKRHVSAFSEVTDAELRDLARVLRSVLGKIHYGLGDPDYNFVVRTRPGQAVDSPYLHWYMSLVPRVSTSAGFELGSGMFINTVSTSAGFELGSGMFINTLLPERAAEFLRRVELPVESPGRALNAPLGATELRP
jgi:UDPglucose--hexose-1-phosphate uridylyltransferase